MRSRTCARDRERSRSLRSQSRGKSQLSQEERGAVKAKKERRPAEKMRSRTSVRDRGRSRNPRLKRSKSHFRLMERDEDGSEKPEERGAGKERGKSQSQKTRSGSLRRSFRSKSRMRQKEKEGSRICVDERRSKSQRRQEKIGTSRDLVEEEKERRRYHRKGSRSKSQLRQREGGAGRTCARDKSERSKSQWRQEERGNGSRAESLLGRSPLHGVGDGKERSTHQNRQSRSDGHFRHQEQRDGRRGRGLVRRRNERSRSPLHGKGERAAYGEGGDQEVYSRSGGVKNIDRTRLAPAMESRRESKSSQPWEDDTRGSKKLTGESGLEKSCYGKKDEVGREFEELCKKEWLVGEVKRLEKVVKERTAKRLKGKRDSSSGVDEQGSERNRDLVAHLEEKYEKIMEGEKHVQDELNSSLSESNEDWKHNSPLETSKIVEQFKVDAGLVLVKTLNLKEENVTMEEVFDSEVKTKMKEKVAEIEEEVYDPEVPTNSSNSSEVEDEERNAAMKIIQNNLAKLWVKKVQGKAHLVDVNSKLVSLKEELLSVEKDYESLVVKEIRLKQKLQ